MWSNEGLEGKACTKPIARMALTSTGWPFCKSIWDYMEWTVLKPGTLCPVLPFEKSVYAE